MVFDVIHNIRIVEGKGIFGFIYNFGGNSVLSISEISEDGCSVVKVEASCQNLDELF
jgi:hypothetical protein